MGLSLTTIAIFLGLAVFYGMLIPARWRTWFLFLSSVILVYWLQPDIFVRWLDFLLPTLTLALTSASWYLTRAKEQKVMREDLFALIIVIILIVGLSLLRFVNMDYSWLLLSRPPPLGFVLILISVIGLFVFTTNQFNIQHVSLLALLTAIFIILKTDPLAVWMSGLIRSGTGQNVALASSIDLNWLGFSYIAFRLIHTVRDRQSGLLPALSLRDYVTYVIFFPAFISGPIDRAERFLADLKTLTESIDFEERYIRGLTRISVGIFKKFVIADTLAQGMSLDPVNATQIDSTMGGWLLLYGYALRLFFDFSGYSDIAIGIGILFGIDLPENFDLPYTRTSITKFWQSWHITLSNWVRFYVFSPLSRYLLKRKPKPSPVMIVLLTQLATMIVMGLWHGVTFNFLIWGVWHGLGLFIHKQWTDRTRKFYRDLKQKPRLQLIANIIAWFITFQFIVLGWIWFALPDFDSAVQLFAILFGLS